jgi:hypothetical protein
MECEYITISRISLLILDTDNPAEIKVLYNIRIKLVGFDLLKKGCQDWSKLCGPHQMSVSIGNHLRRPNRRLIIKKNDRKYSHFWVFQEISRAV